jgi:hypothetical protein
MSEAAPVPKLTAEFLARTMSTLVENVVKNVKIPVMAEGSNVLTVAAESYGKLAQKAESAEKTARAFDAKASNSALAFNNETERSFSASFSMPTKPTDLGRA